MIPGRVIVLSVIVAFLGQTHLFFMHVNRKSADQPTHPRSLISASIYSLFALYTRNGSRISGRGFRCVEEGVRFADIISFFLKGTATLMITTIYMKDLNKP